MLTEQELNKIFSWLPYREDWEADKKEVKDYYRDVIYDFTNSNQFETYISQDGGMSNYLEFFCYPIKHNGDRVNSIIVCISLCAPIAAFGQTTISYINSESISHNFLELELVNVVIEKELKPIEKAIVTILRKHNFSIINRNFAGIELPIEVAENLESLNEGTKYLHGLFQWTD